MEEITEEQIAQNYSACLDSVNLLDRGQPEDMSNIDWKDCESRNVRHLELMLTKDYWTTENMNVIKAAI